MPYQDILVDHVGDVYKDGVNSVKLRFCFFDDNSTEQVVYVTERAFQKMLVRENNRGI